jgi:hypothetical protein
MTFTEQDVEQIVIEVIRRLGGLPRATHPKELKLDERVITLRSIEGKLADVKRMLVAANAVVTPAVKDELTAREIELVREGHS